MLGVRHVNSLFLELLCDCLLLCMRELSLDAPLNASYKTPHYPPSLRHSNSCENNVTRAWDELQFHHHSFITQIVFLYVILNLASDKPDSDKNWKR